MAAVDVKGLNQPTQYNSRILRRDKCQRQMPSLHKQCSKSLLFNGSWFITTATKYKNANEIQMTLGLSFYRQTDS